LFGVAIGLIRTRPYDDGGLSAFLASSSGCLSPCWNGVRPNFTTYDEALSLLKSSEIVRDLGSDMRQDNGHIFWHWAVQRPSFLANTDDLGYASVKANIVRGLYLPGLRSYLDAWFALGVPQQIIVYSNAFWGIQNVIYLAVYPNQLYIASPLFCAATTRDLWNAKPAVFIGQMPQYAELYAFVYEPGDFRGWLPYQLC
jgi:hypothetical protein